MKYKKSDVPDFRKAEGSAFSLKGRMLRQAVVRKSVKSLTGDIEDLRSLSCLADSDIQSSQLRLFLSGLMQDVDRKEGMATLFARLGSSINRQAKKKLIGNLIYNWGYVGEKIRYRFASYEQWLPGTLVISPTMRCNLHCTGCYSGLYEKAGDLNEEEIDSILDQARKLGIYFVVVSGGEPYVLKDMWLRLFRKYSDMYFLTFTNGTFIDRETARALGKLGNVAPAISVEGYAAETDERRGKGVHAKVLNAMHNLREEGVLFGTSVTYTSKNIDTITSDEFVKYYIDQGAIFSWFFMFMPVGKDPILDLVPSPEQRLMTGRRIADLRKRLPIFLADFWNDGPAVGGCLAGGRSYLHIVSNGQVEPCVFAHFGIDNIREKPLIEVVNSPFFKAIRNRYPYSDNANLMRPCMIIDNPEVLRSVVAEYLVPEGHPHSEDLIHDPDVISWIDTYAQEFKELTDPIWNERIADEKYRWYKEGKEYPRLFWFRRQAANIKPADPVEEMVMQEK
ncbi:radical SAM protein [Sediminispirochaeta smaragdinae]|uniref:Radical SAM domain protein n=1 Tax=Sediminispirochaeta smaragdinae (strain DSM 11293 / JCM 15392 / SEBR 4228) TaxID=573413 RepID=E1R2U0_SEDSS|nr:radical SAM protein [Sediminispirochaeta smaragdinae]ADK80372.1 Radical SAM domain protein [Sediminispirochaeta smaragdinae DSM 11293]